MFESKLGASNEDSSTLMTFLLFYQQVKITHSTLTEHNNPDSIWSWMLSLLFVPLLHWWRFRVGQLQEENLLQELVSAAAQVQTDGVVQHGIERARVQQHRHVTSSESDLKRRFMYLMIRRPSPSSQCEHKRLVIQKKRSSRDQCW